MTQVTPSCCHSAIYGPAEPQRTRDGWAMIRECMACGIRRCETPYFDKREDLMGHWAALEAHRAVLSTQKGREG